MLRVLDYDLLKELGKDYEQDFYSQFRDFSLNI